MPAARLGRGPRRSMRGTGRGSLIRDSEAETATRTRRLVDSEAETATRTRRLVDSKAETDPTLGSVENVELETDKRRIQPPFLGSRDGPDKARRVRVAGHR